MECPVCIEKCPHFHSTVQARAFEAVSLPLQASVYVTALLFGLCQEISRIGGHAVHRYAGRK